jgi:hypothetical protein
MAINKMLRVSSSRIISPYWNGHCYIARTVMPMESRFSQWLIRVGQMMLRLLIARDHDSFDISL